MVPKVYPLLTGAAPVTAIVADRIWHNDVPDDRARPVPDAYLTWTFTATPEIFLSAPRRGIDRQAVTVDCWSMNQAQCEALADAVRDAIEPHFHLVSIPVDAREPDTKLHRISLQFDFWGR